MCYTFTGPECYNCVSGLFRTVVYCLTGLWREREREREGERVCVCERSLIDGGNDVTIVSDAVSSGQFAFFY